MIHFLVSHPFARTLSKTQSCAEASKEEALMCCYHLKNSSALFLRKSTSQKQLSQHIHSRSISVYLVVMEFKIQKPNMTINIYPPYLTISDSACVSVGPIFWGGYKPSPVPCFFPNKERHRKCPFNFRAAATYGVCCHAFFSGEPLLCTGMVPHIFPP